MNRPIQFSLGQLMAAVTWFCLAAGSISSFIAISTQSYPRVDWLALSLVLFVTSFCFTGACIGSLFGRSFVGLMVGSWLGIAILPAAPFLLPSF